jgi:hypothetical protein
MNLREQHQLIGNSDDLEQEVSPYHQTDGLLICGTNAVVSITRAPQAHTGPLEGQANAMLVDDFIMLTR